MTEIIEAFSYVNATSEKAEQFYIKLIKFFEDDDCDTLKECLGEDILFDIAFYKTHPWEDGYRAAEDGDTEDCNPWAPETTEYKKWSSGWREGRFDTEYKRE